MGVEARITVYAPSERMAKEASKVAFQRISALDAIMSDYRKDSELNRFCRAPQSEATNLSPELWQVLLYGQQLAEETGGAFDVTAGPVVRLWRQARKSGRLPAEEALEQALAHCGWSNLWLDPQQARGRLHKAGMQLDLGGIAKGYAADEALRVLVEAGLPRALIDFGGDLVAGEAPPGRPGWRILVEDSGTALPNPYLWLRWGALSTSGDKVQFLEVEGVRYSHVVDPRTGIGLRHRLAVTVQAKRGIESDSLATAIGVLGETEGRALAARHQVLAWIRPVEGRSEGSGWEKEKAD